MHNNATDNYSKVNNNIGEYNNNDLSKFKDYYNN